MRPRFLELDGTAQPPPDVGALFCQGCGASMLVGDEVSCRHCSTVLCEGCVEWQDGWHCRGHVEDFALAMDMLAWALAFAAPDTWRCCSGGHAKLKTDRATFEASVENCREWQNAGLVLGDCPTCGSTLAMPMESHVEVAA